MGPCHRSRSRQGPRARPRPRSKGTAPNEPGWPATSQHWPRRFVRSFGRCRAGSGAAGSTRRGGPIASPLRSETCLCGHACNPLRRAVGVRPPRGTWSGAVAPRISRSAAAAARIRPVQRRRRLDDRHGVGEHVQHRAQLVHLGEMDELGSVLNVLAESVPVVEPPAALKGRILAAAAADLEMRGATAPTRSRPRPNANSAPSAEPAWAPGSPHRRGPRDRAAGRLEPAAPGPARPGPDVRAECRGRARRRRPAGSLTAVLTPDGRRRVPPALPRSRAMARSGSRCAT